jgi:hypothetical protein
MGIYSKDIIAQAKKWLGKKESDGSFKEIIDVYNSHKPLARGYKVKYTDNWCATFVSAVAIKCGATNILPTECGCEKMIEKYKALGVWKEDENRTPNAGDIIFYDWNDKGVGDNKGWSDHVGIVEEVKAGKISVIEGNYNESVKRRSIAINSVNIRGYAVPKYDKEVASKPAQSVSTAKTYKDGDIIKLKAGAKYYNGVPIPAWVFKKTIYYRGTNKNGVVFSILKTGAVTGVVKPEYLK